MSLSLIHIFLQLFPHLAEPPDQAEALLHLGQLGFRPLDGIPHALPGDPLVFRDFGEGEIVVVIQLYHVALDVYKRQENDSSAAAAEEWELLRRMEEQNRADRERLAETDEQLALLDRQRQQAAVAASRRKQLEEARRRLEELNAAAAVMGEARGRLELAEHARDVYKRQL